MFRLISSIGLVMATYAGFALLGPVLGAADFKMALFLANPVWTVPLPSGGTWPVEIGAIFLLLGLTALGIETLTTARAGGRTIGYRALSIRGWPAAWRCSCSLRASAPRFSSCWLRWPCSMR